MVLATSSRDNDYEQSGPTFTLLRGQFVAVETLTLGREVAEYALNVVDLRRGRLGPSYDPIIFEVPSDRATGSAIGRMVISRRGNAIWTARNFFTSPLRREVYRLQGGDVSRLDRGPKVELDSLRLRDGRATWRSGGARQSAELR
jgi:hypothetical protein